MDSVVHAARGAAVAGGGLTLLQSLLSRRLQRPSGFALSVGSFVGTFRLIESLGSKQTDGNEDETSNKEIQQKQSRVPSAAAGIAAIVALYFLEAKRKGLLISYAALEAVLLLVKEHATLAEIKHIEIPFAVLACQRIIYTWIYEASLLTKSQLATLDGLTKVPSEVLARVRSELPVNAEISRCEIFHPAQTCRDFHAGFFKLHVKESMKLYIPIYFVSAVLTKYDKWIWGPRPDLQQLIVQYLRTCGCLTMSFIIPLGFSCISPIKHHRISVVIAGMLTALALWIEHEKRRLTVVKSIALYPIAASASQLGLLLRLSQRSIALWQYFLFSASMAVLFQRPERQNAKVMRLLFGHKLKSAPRQPSSATSPKGNKTKA